MKKFKIRIVYLIITLIAILLGLLSRKFMGIFPKGIAPYIGDMLWASMVYFGVRMVFPKLKLKRIFIIAIIFSFGIEISQLYQSEWINNIRSTVIGGLILGHGFLWQDLLAYTFGITIGLLLDRLFVDKYIK